MSAIDDISDWLSVGPGAPHFAQMLPGTVPAGPSLVLKDFGAAQGDSVFGGLRLEISPPPQDVLAPTNGLLWQVPNVPALSADKQKRFRDNWPPLRRMNGDSWLQDPLPGLIEENDLLFEVWPGAFRRIESLFAALDFPIPGENLEKHYPQMPVPRWFLVRGLSAARIENAAKDIVAAQFPSDPNRNLVPFQEGQEPIYVPVASSLGLADDGSRVEIWVFDSEGLNIDPAYVFGTFALLADQIEFAHLAKPDAATVTAWEGVWSGQLPPRHTLMFCDHRGTPYEPWEDPPNPAQPVPPPAPSRSVAIPAKSINSTVAAHGVLIYADGSNEYSSLVDELVQLTLEGEHTRIGLQPHGTTGEELWTGFRNRSCFRVRVVDNARWLPLNDNDRNEFARYTEGNEYLPLIDGRDTYRELYRAIRASHVQESYADENHIPGGTPLPPATAQQSRILAINCWISAGDPLLGQRGMLTTARTQPGAVPPDDLPDQFVFIPSARFADDTPQPWRHWWLVAPSGTLPPGAFVSLRQIEVSTAFEGDDPRLPGAQGGTDLYGLVAPVGNPVWSFVGANGQFALRAIFDPGWSHQAELRVTTWEPDPEDPDPLSTETAGKGQESTRKYGTVTLAFPGNALTPPDPPGIDLNVRAHLAWNGTPGAASVVLPPGMITDLPKTAIVLNSRTGDFVTRSVTDNASEVVIDLANFAREDAALLGFGPSGAADPADCDAFFELRSTDAQKNTGLVPVHPKEVAGLLREAIGAGVDVRVLPWDDVTANPAALMAHSLGAVQAVNADIDGKRGQGLLDPITREPGVHHQKATLVQTPDEIYAFVGGIDLKLGRYDQPPHADPDPDRSTGLWHDLHCRLRGRAVWDVYRNFQQRWNVAQAHPDVGGGDPQLTPLPAPTQLEIDGSPDDGPHTVQINRTLAPKLAAYSQIVNTDIGDRSILQSYERAFAQARQFLYLEEQYIFNTDVADILHQRLHGGHLEFLFLVLPRKLNEFPVLDLALYAVRRRAINKLIYGKEKLEPADGDGTGLSGYVGDRVAVMTLVVSNRRPEPVYVHAKSIVADDLWMSIGSSNLSRRSMTLDSELNAVCLDRRLRRGGHITPRNYRVDLLAEHLRLFPEERPLVEDPRTAFRLVKSVLAGERPWMETGIVPYDPNFTQYGVQPPDFDPLFPYALQAFMDPDGSQLNIGLHLSDMLGLINSLKLADLNQADTLGDVSAVRVTSDLNAVSGGPFLAEFELVETGAPAGTPNTVGPLPTAEAAYVGFGRRGVQYQVSATAARVSDPNTVVATAQQVFIAGGFITNLTLVFTV